MENRNGLRLRVRPMAVNNGERIGSTGVERALNLGGADT